MDFYKVVDDVLALLRGRGRVTYRALKVQFHLDDEQLEALKEEVIYAKRLAVDEENRVLVWIGEQATVAPPTTAPSIPESISPPPTEHEREPLTYTPRHLAEKILTSRSALEGERKQVTVLFCDLAHSTAIAEKIGPEAMHTLLNRFFELALNEVHRYEGTINQFLGDGFMALFGAPISHEDHARRGVLSALSLQRALKEAELGKPYGVECAFRMGLNSGLVVVGSIGDNLRMDYSAIGDTTNLAARLQQQAEPGDILVSENTSRLVQGYIRLEALAPVEIRGKTEPVSMYKVIGTLPRRSPVVSRGERTLSQFVGRERELAVLDELFHQVESGQGQVVGVVAEAGGGKSRLLYEFRQRLQGKRVTYLEGRCLSYGQTIPYHPIIDILRNNCDIRETDSPEHIAEKVRFALQEVDMDPEESAPYLLQLLGVREGTESIAVLTPEAIRTRTFETLKHMSLKGSQQRLLIFELEDLHWIDKTSEDYLASLVESLAGASMMLLTTYRPGYRPPWRDKSYAIQISLHSLPPHDALHVVHSTSQHTQLPEQLERIIIAKAEGNPFFLEELTRAVIDHTDSETHIDIPDTVQGVLMARIDRLPEEPKRLLQTASVLGREFSPSVLNAMWDEVDALGPLLLELKRFEFLYERTGVDEPIYVFKHALTQDVAYESLLTTRRQTLHEVAAQALEALYADRLEDAYDRLAYHYTNSHNAPKAVAYLSLVAEKAAGHSAYVEAICHFTKGLEVLKTLPTTSERTLQELDLQTRLGSALMTTKGYAAPETQQAYSQARALCQQVGETPQLFPVLRGLWILHTVRAEFVTAQELGEQCLRLAQSLQDPTLLPEAHFVLGGTQLWLGKLVPALEHMQAGIALYDPQHHRSLVSLYGQDPGMACLCYAAWALWLLGYPAQALQRIHQALTLTREISHPYSLAVALNFATRLHQLRREGDAVQEQAEAAIALATEQGFAYWVAQGRILHGWALTTQEGGAECVAHMQQGLADLLTTGAELLLPYLLALLAEVSGQRGQSEEGLRLLAKALAVVNKNGERWWEAEIHRLHGVLLLSQSSVNLSEAEPWFHKALHVAQSQQAKSLELRAATSLAKLWQTQGKRQDAYDLLAPVYNWFTEGFDTADLKDAKALLDELSEGSP